MSGCGSYRGCGSYSKPVAKKCAPKKVAASKPAAKPKTAASTSRASTRCSCCCKPATCAPKKKEIAPRSLQKPSAGVVVVQVNMTNIQVTPTRRTQATAVAPNPATLPQTPIPTPTIATPVTKNVVAAAIEAAVSAKKEAEAEYSLVRAGRRSSIYPYQC